MMWSEMDIFYWKRNYGQSLEKGIHTNGASECLYVWVRYKVDSWLFYWMPSVFGEKVCVHIQQHQRDERWTRLMDIVHYVRVNRTNPRGLSPELSSLNKTWLFHSCHMSWPWKTMFNDQRFNALTGSFQDFDIGHIVIPFHPVAI